MPEVRVVGLGPQSWPQKENPKTSMASGGRPDYEKLDATHNAHKILIF